ncbi:SH3 domain-containing protein [aff. Roholtiella sp. LEGE 12411]|uniref:SH3 domain-containing protein n=1 Tax=aff. Roholtiella sp. LEGE 12411 TaxID=1828822 RepID=UPI001882E3A6|nr:SH3 domain-containing protein [aff. Roholtiella sp. LEGE 12411]MBE9034075.1 SH3 domain-containing protein [aff. Roholtiella sp. LEGE 12411]
MLSGLLKFTLGFFLAIAVLIGGGVATALYFINRTAIPPAKPIFANDSPQVKAQAGASSSTPTPGAATQSSVDSTSTPNPTESPKIQSPKPLPPGTYRGRVSWSQGLSLRAEPNQEAQRIGGVGFNQKIIILEESEDKTWQKIRVEANEQEGWVKAGNTKKVDEQQPEQSGQQ